MSNCKPNSIALPTISARSLLSNYTPLAYPMLTSAQITYVPSPFSYTSSPPIHSPLLSSPLTSLSLTHKHSPLHRSVTRYTERLPKNTSCSLMMLGWSTHFNIEISVCSFLR